MRNVIEELFAYGKVIINLFKFNNLNMPYLNSIKKQQNCKSNLSRANYLKFLTFNIKTEKVGKYVQLFQFGTKYLHCVCNLYYFSH